MIKRLPYGISNYELLITKHYYYVDKTKYIEQLEREPNPYQFFIRPRKFGKSLFISTLNHYYDLNKADQFDALFKDTYIAQHPTEERNSYAIINFNFSGLDTGSAELFMASFEENIRQAVLTFLEKNANLFSNTISLIEDICETKRSISALLTLFRSAEVNCVPLFVIIDEYDHFANDLIALGTDEVYKMMVRANGIVRDFYETLKIGTSTILNRIFITGISPVMLDDLTSGFNIASNLTLDEKYNEMMGFTQSELEAIVAHCGIDSELIDVPLLKSYYDGYLFNEDASERLYNPTMLFYYLNSLVSNHRPPKQLYDENLRTDYNRLKRLINNDANRAQLEHIIMNEGIEAELLSKFSIDNLGDTRYFVSLLFYMGLLTIDGYVGNRLRLRIPNYTIKTLYWEYLGEMITGSNAGIRFDNKELADTIDLLAAGEITPFVQHVSKHIVNKFSNRDLLRFDEKYIKAILLTCLINSRLYYPISERENSAGYSDIYLRRNPQFPNIKYEWIFELKYLKEMDHTKIPKLIEEAKKQLAGYVAAEQGEQRTDLKSAVLLFIGKKQVEIVTSTSP